MPSSRRSQSTAGVQVTIKNTSATVQYRVNAEKSIKQDAQLSQRDRAAGGVIVFAKSRRLELGDNILRTLGL